MNTPKNFLKSSQKTHRFILSLVYFLFKLISELYLTNKWLKLSVGVMFMQSPQKGIHCNSCKLYVAMHMMPMTLLSALNLRGCRWKTTWFFSLCSKHIVKPAPGWNFRQFLKPGWSLSGSKLLYYIQSTMCNIQNFELNSSSYVLFRLRNLKLERDKKCWAFPLLPCIDSFLGSSRLVRGWGREVYLEGCIFRRGSPPSLWFHRLFCNVIL